MLGVSCWTLFRHRDAEERGSRANTAVRIGGFVLVLIASCGLATLHWDPGALRQTAGGVVGSSSAGLASGLEFPRRDAAADRRVDGGPVAGLRRLVAHDHRLARRLDLARRRLAARRARSDARDVAEGRERKQARMEA